MVELTMLNQVKLKLFETGYCLNFEKFVAANKQMKVARFYAMVGLIEHLTLGPILFDTGYSPHLMRLCKKPPYIFYRFITPIHFDGHLSAANQVQRFGYKPEQIKHIIISHFHPDHIGGLKDFTEAKFHCSKEAYSKIKNLSFLQALKEVFFHKLLPTDFEERVCFIEENPVDLDYLPFTKGYDLFGDQTLVAIDLPGHAIGQIGLFLQTDSQAVLMCADACWQSSNYINPEYPYFLAKLAIHNYQAFIKTLHDLRELKNRNPKIEIIPSHCGKMWKKYVDEDKPC